MKRCLFLLVWIYSWPAMGQWIAIQDRQVVAYHAKNYEGGLFNEGPRLFRANGKLAPAQRPFEANYQSLYLPLVYLVNLEADYHIDSILFFDDAGSDSLKISIGHPGKWQNILETKTNQYKAWRRIDLKKNTSFLRLEFASPQAKLGEIILFGQKKEPGQKEVTRYAFKKLSFDEFLGINAFVDDPLLKIKGIASSIREYHNWDWHYQQGVDLNEALISGPAFAPSPAGPWDFDRYYQEAQSMGLKIYPCLQYSPPWLREEKSFKPIPNHHYSYDFESYRWHSNFCFQFAARYGSKKVPKSMLRLAPGQSYKSGLNLINGLETWNEPDCFWEGPEAYFSAPEFAAMLSADYDGHEGRLGLSHGVKQADPDLEFIMGGITRLDTHYVEGIRLWSEFNRQDGAFPADVINFHHYSNDVGGQDAKAKRGISPEEDHLFERLREIVAYRNRKLPRQKIYLSEFGYDTNPKSVQAPLAADSMQALERQANLILRSFLIAHASGIDGAFLYMFRDVNAPNPNKYMSSGLSREKWHQHEPKLAYERLKNLKLLLEGFYFVADLPFGLSHHHCFHYRNEQGQNRYVFWSSKVGSSSLSKEIPFLQAEKGQYYSPAKPGLMKTRPWQYGQILEVTNCPQVLAID